MPAFAKYGQSAQRQERQCRGFPAHVVKEWAGHASYETTDAFYLKVSEAEYETAATQEFSDYAQLCTQPGDSETTQEEPE